MKILINENISLHLFSKTQANIFFRSIVNGDLADSFDLNLKNKYSELYQVEKRIEDAVENKFKIDGTPDFFILYNNEIAGVFEFHPMTTEDFLEVGYWLFSSYRQKGILSAVFPKMIEYSKKHFNKSRLIAYTSIQNLPSISLLKSMNFIPTGIIVDGETEFEYFL
jgi:RimJ/RimL family protein N-acetyltransferase